MRIAIVDDLETERAQLKTRLARQLRLCGAEAELLEFESGESFLAAEKEQRFTAAFLDIYMHGMSGMDAAKELRTLCDALLETLDLAFQAFEKDDLAIAHQVEPLEEVIDTLNLELKNRHIKRLQNEECTVELGYIYQDLLTNIERISDHCSNIAGVLIEIDEKQNIHKWWDI